LASGLRAVLKLVSTGKFPELVAKVLMEPVVTEA
jgi:hypothetical protein